MGRRGKATLVLGTKSEQRPWRKGKAGAGPAPVEFKQLSWGWSSVKREKEKRKALVFLLLADKTSRKGLCLI